MLTQEEFTHWLDSYKSAWETGDPEAAVSLFSEDAEYLETPFDDAMVGHQAIRDYWAEGAKNSQKDIHFSAQVIAQSGNSWFAFWQANFRRIPSNQYVELNGVLAASFSTDNRCERFREWWHRRATDTK